MLIANFTAPGRCTGSKTMPQSAILVTTYRRKVQLLIGWQSISLAKLHLTLLHRHDVDVDAAKTR
jgi:hypothetical protein